MVKLICTECYDFEDITVDLTSIGKNRYSCSRCGAIFHRKNGELAYIDKSSSYDNDDDSYDRVYGGNKPVECAVCGCDNYPKCMDACHLFGN